MIWECRPAKVWSITTHSRWEILSHSENCSQLFILRRKGRRWRWTCTMTTTRWGRWRTMSTWWSTLPCSLKSALAIDKTDEDEMHNFNFLIIVNKNIRTPLVAVDYKSAIHMICITYTLVLRIRYVKSPTFKLICPVWRLRWLLLSWPSLVVTWSQLTTLRHSASPAGAEQEEDSLPMFSLSTRRGRCQ